jgi:hypothetical protein
MSKLIEFIAPESYLKSNPPLPKPIKLNIPEWFKNIPHTHNKFTIKGCMPFLDSLTTGYVLGLPQDFLLMHNFYEDGVPRSRFEPSIPEQMEGLNINHKKDIQEHPVVQVQGSPLEKKNLNLPIHKVLNPWIIKTPPGYSCLFVPPLNNSDDRFSIVSGIVDTDQFNLEINFPFVVNGDKYPTLNTFLKEGLPYVQIIPFKRDSWRMKIKEKTKKDHVNFFKYLTKFWKEYRNKFWQKKQWR